MANKKKKTNNKKVAKKTTKKQPVRKQTIKKQEPKQKVVEEPSKVFKDFIILVVVLLGVFAVVYGLTVGARKLGWFDTRYSKPDTEEAKIDYTNISAGTMFNREEEHYYVLIGDFTNLGMYLSQVVSNYKQKEDALKIYKVNTAEGMNSYLIGEESAVTSSYPDRLSINDYTLLEVQGGANISAYVGEEKIAEKLK